MSSPLEIFKNALIKNKYIERYAAINSYICDRFYHVIYKREYDEKRVNGVLLNYNGGTVDLLAEDGVYHIEYKDIIYMQPIKMPEDRISEQFKKLLEALSIEL